MYLNKRQLSLCYLKIYAVKTHNLFKITNISRVASGPRKPGKTRNFIV